MFFSKKNKIERIVVLLEAIFSDGAEDSPFPWACFHCNSGMFLQLVTVL